MERYHALGTDLRAACRHMGREHFVASYPQLWLAQDLASHARHEPSFNTAASTLTDGANLVTVRLRRAREAPQQFGFVRLERSGRHPWEGRVLVGRATNNDVVLRHASVSKFHARVTHAAGVWLLTDTDSSNGTWVDGTLLDEGVGVPLRNGALVTFGSIACLVLDSASVYDALVPGDAGTPPPPRPASSAG